MNRPLVSAFLLVALGTPAVAQSLQVTIYPSADAAIYAESGGAANGAGEYLFVGANSGGNLRRSLARYDVAGSIPAGSIVTQVVCVVFVSQGNTSVEPFNAQRVLASWSEGASNPTGSEGQGTAAAAGDTTWTMRDFGASVPWSVPGGDLAPELSVQGSVAGVGSSWVAVTARGVADVQLWLDQPAQNFGWCFTGNETVPGSAKRLDSRQSLDPSLRPFLLVNCFPPLAHPDTYCVLTPNSAGPGAAMGWSGSTSVAANNFVLSVTGAPPSTTGLFFFGSFTGVFGPFGDGNLCVPAPRHRLGVQTVDGSGGASRIVDLTTFPGTLLTPMSTASFQFWFRDAAAGGAGFNLSNAIWSPFFP